MSITVQCSQCKMELKVGPELAGKRAKCPGCGNIFTVPGAAAPAASPGPAPAAPQWQPPPSAPPSPYQQQRGPITRPETFHTLYKWFWICTIGAFVAVGMVLVMFAIAVMAAGTTTQPTFTTVGSTTKASDPITPRTDPPSEGGILAMFTMCFGCISYGALLVFNIGSTVFFLILLYKAWDLIQDGEVQTSPGQAVGFLFIPFFNLYWCFVAIRGLAVDLNKYSRARGIAAEEARVDTITIGLALYVASFCTFYLTLIPGVIFILLGMKSVANAAASVAAAKLAA